MKSALKISGYCLIRKNRVVLDGRVLFETGPMDFSSFAAEAYLHFNTCYPKFHKMDNLSKLGFLASDILIRDKKITESFKGREIAIMLMNSSSSLDTDKTYQQTITDRNNYFPSPAVFVYTLPNVVIGEICIRHKIYGEGNFFITEKFDAILLDHIVNHLFNDGLALCCIAGWTEVNGENYESALFLIEESSGTGSGIANFGPAETESIYQGI
ncbi:MAG: hypothetical protein MUE74_09075 [Bacteroidales bacterium]|nr:hypothetical protein [Bacteroidales bacterium]